jgi:hypothetical protein
MRHACAVFVARASRPLGRGHPARARGRERDAPETAGEMPTLHTRKCPRHTWLAHQTPCLWESALFP